MLVLTNQWRSDRCILRFQFALTLWKELTDEEIDSRVNFFLLFLATSLSPPITKWSLSFPKYILYKTAC
jgi:hypothetical protein